MVGMAWLECWVGDQAWRWVVHAKTTNQSSSCVFFQWAPSSLPPSALPFYIWSFDSCHLFASSVPCLPLHTCIPYHHVLLQPSLPYLHFCAFAFPFGNLLCVQAFPFTLQFYCTIPRTIPHYYRAMPMTVPPCLPST